jgi:hypothetical protein
MASSFSLIKWYLDCVTDEGEVTIVYLAELRWHGVHLHLASVVGGIEESMGTRSSMSPCRLSSNGGRICAEHAKLGVLGIWEADATAVERTVYENGSGYVRWNCLQPRSLVQLRVKDRELTGLGYAECLTLTIPPWQLPMRQLRWGRFVSPEDSLAWVDWQGPFSTNFAIHNGEETKLNTVTEAEVRFPGATLTIERGLALRSGRLGSTILPGIPALGMLLPSSLFNVEECKWRSRGTLVTKDRGSSGWVIHEVVQWSV